MGSYCITWFANLPATFLFRQLQQIPGGNFYVALHCLQACSHVDTSSVCWTWEVSPDGWFSENKRILFKCHWTNGRRLCFHQNEFSQNCHRLILCDSIRAREAMLNVLQKAWKKMLKGSRGKKKKKKENKVKDWQVSLTMIKSTKIHTPPATEESEYSKTSQQNTRLISPGAPSHQHTDILLPQQEQWSDVKTQFAPNLVSSGHSRSLILLSPPTPFS